MPIFFVVPCCFVLLVVGVMSSQIICSVCVYVVCFPSYVLSHRTGTDGQLLNNEKNFDGNMNVILCKITSGDASTTNINHVFDIETQAANSEQSFKSIYQYITKRTTTTIISEVIVNITTTYISEHFNYGFHRNSWCTCCNLQTTMFLIKYIGKNNETSVSVISDIFPSKHLNNTEFINHY